MMSKSLYRISPWKPVSLSAAMVSFRIPRHVLPAWKTPNKNKYKKY